MSATADMVLGVHDAGDVDQYLSFMLGGEEYALNILNVREVRSWEGAAHMPNTPQYIRGVINLRGAIIPIVDLRLRLGMEAIEDGDNTVVIVLVAEIGDPCQRHFGVLGAVDAQNGHHHHHSDEYGKQDHNLVVEPHSCLCLFQLVWIP